MQMFERHHAAAAAAFVALFDLPEMADAAEPRAIEDDQLHPREMQAKAGVDARSERRVAVELPFDRYRLRVLGEIFVPADERRRSADRVARATPHPFEPGLLHVTTQGRDDSIPAQDRERHEWGR